MRNSFAKKITELATINNKLTLLAGDIGNRLFDDFKRQNPDKFFNCGVAEQNMIGVSAGLAQQGFLPFVYTIAPFCTSRCFEQIRVDVCYHNVPVTIVAVGAGLSYANLGPTHHSFEDIAILRTLPNMRILCPADPDEVEACLELAVAEPKPTYIRLGKKGEPRIHERLIDRDELISSIHLRKGKKICLVSTGTLLKEVIDCSNILSQLGHNPSVYSVPQVKPFPFKFFEEIFSKYHTIAVFEEHSIIGGFGAAIAEWVIDNQVNTSKLLRFGINDEFYTKSGSQSYARHAVGLHSQAFASRILKAILGSENENTCSNFSSNQKAIST